MHRFIASYHAVGVDSPANQRFFAPGPDHPQVYPLCSAPVDYVDQPVCGCPGYGGNGTYRETLPLKRVEYLSHAERIIG